MNPNAAHRNPGTVCHFKLRWYRAGQVMCTDIYKFQADKPVGNRQQFGQCQAEDQVKHQTGTRDKKADRKVRYRRLVGLTGLRRQKQVRGRQG